MAGQPDRMGGPHGGDNCHRTSAPYTSFRDVSESALLIRDKLFSVPLPE
jgi:hypothetical protein